jgi:hypothetical protein
MMAIRIWSCPDQPEDDFCDCAIDCHGRYWIAREKIRIVHPGDGAHEEPVAALSNLRGMREFKLNGERAHPIAGRTAAH